MKRPDRRSARGAPPRVKVCSGVFDPSLPVVSDRAWPDGPHRRERWRSTAPSNVLLLDQNAGVTARMDKPDPPTHPTEVALSAHPRPLRFVWQMDAELRFTVASGEFASLMGSATASLLGRSWPDIAAALGLDPAGQITQALARRETWSGVSMAWPAGDDGTRVAVELSGLPVFDRDRALVGFRGFG